MQILVVSGFLGAGKTTFIQELARRTGRDFVVYENEYAQADIDARVLAESDELSVWESTENCICCTGKQDFATSILTISNSLDPEFLVVEPTGVARLSSILENVDQVSYERISLLEPLAIVDALAWVRQRERFEDIYLDQVKTAPTVVISKVQLAGVGEVGDLVAWLREVNPEAVVVDKPWEQLDNAWFESFLLHARGKGAAVENNESAAASSVDDFESLSLSGAVLPTETHLIAFLDALVAGVYGEIVRAKGTIPCGKQWLRFDVVDRAWSITGAEPDERGEEGSLAVFIGPEVCRPWLRETLLPLVREAVAAGQHDAAFDESSDIEHRHHHHHDDGDCDCDEHDHSHCDHEHGHCAHEHHDHDHAHHDHEHHGEHHYHHE